MVGNAPPQPKKTAPPATWEHRQLFDHVLEALSALPLYFRSETHLAGIHAMDLHTLNQLLGATIEQQVVLTLNEMRAIWDPSEKYKLFHFVRQPQTFPDVLFCRADNVAEPILGIEVKGWFALAKEGEPNYRFRVTPAACNTQDLIVVVPWFLAQVVSGRPVVLSPYVESAKYAAEYRNWWWEHVRDSKDSAQKRSIRLPTGVAPYPSKKDKIDDDPVNDSGSNFGRLARTGMMDTYKEGVKRHELCGVPVEYWLQFFAAFQEKATGDEIRKALLRLSKQVRGKAEGEPSSDKVVTEVFERVRQLLDPD